VSGRRRGSTERGQGLVEFALVVPVFFLLVFGVIDGARLVFTVQSVNQAAREAARLAAVEAPFIGKTGAACTAPSCPANAAALRSDVVAAANRMSGGVGPFVSGSIYIACTAAAGTIPSGSWTTSNDCATNATAGAGNTVSVRIVVQFLPTTPIVGQLIDAMFPAAEPLSSTSSMGIP
jgi:Flp pilus assembly protein TadG